MTDTSDLEATITFLKRKIKANRLAVDGLNAQISKYDGMIAQGGDGYDVKSLAESNDHARKQIEKMDAETATAKMQISDTRKMMEYVEKTASIAEGVTLDVAAD